MKKLNLKSANVSYQKEQITVATWVFTGPRAQTYISRRVGVRNPPGAIYSEYGRK
jgi:hypothetical protein